VSKDFLYSFFFTYNLYIFSILTFSLPISKFILFLLFFLSLNKLFTYGDPFELEFLLDAFDADLFYLP